MQQIPFAISSTVSRNKKANSEELINLYADNMTPTSKNQVTLIGTPGLKLLATLPTNPILGSHVFNQEFYVVTSTKLYKVNQFGGYAELGDVDFYDKVSIADNGKTMIMVQDKAYYYDNVSVQRITDPDYYPSSSVDFMDGYYVLVRDDTKQFFISRLYSIEFDGLDFASVEGSPDNLLGLLRDHEELWLFKERSTEIWYNSGAADFPFIKNSGAFIEIGCLDKNSIQKINNTVFWVGDDKIVYGALGSQPQRISTSGIEYELAKQSASISSFTYNEEGHYFYCLILPTKTLCFDTKTGLWHTRKSIDRRWIISGAENVYGSIFGYDEGSNIYRISLDYYDEEEVPITREAITAPLTRNVNRNTLYRYQLDMETGETKIIDNPEIYLQYSDDGAKTWSNLKRATIGTIGNYKTRAIWRRLGSFRDRTIKITIREAVPMHIIASFADIKPWRN